MSAASRAGQTSNRSWTRSIIRRAAVNSLPHRRARFHIHDDGVLQVDQIIGAVGEERLTALGAGPARGRIGRRQELRNDRRRGAKRGIVEHGQIFVHRMVGRLRRQGLTAANPALAISIGCDQARISNGDR